MDELIRKRSRAFNEVIIDQKMGHVHKSSRDGAKLQAEAYWYNNIPWTLGAFVPKQLLLMEDPAELIMEYCPYTTLSEVFTSSKYIIDWKRIVLRLIEIHSIFRNQAAPMNITDDLHKFQKEKTLERVKIMKQDSRWKDLMILKTLYINGKEYKNLDINNIFKIYDKYSYVARPAVVHGDYCLSNILYDLKTNCVKLIDPRGYLLKKDEPTIFGDSHYDYAKLMHSIEGLYDFIVQDKYMILRNSLDSFTLNIPAPDYSGIVRILDSESVMLNALEYRKILQVLLFLSMIPLHYDDANRQLAFYLRAVQLYSIFV